MKGSGRLVGLLAALCAAACSDSNGGDTEPAAWVVAAGGLEEDEGTAIAVDSAGNSLVTGYFEDNMVWGSTSLPSAGDTDLFLAKLDSQGQQLWAVSAGGAGNDRGYGVAVDGAGNSLVTGQFSGSATFGSIALTSRGELDIFVARHDGAGRVSWAVSAGGSENDRGLGVAVDSAGNALVAGVFSGRVVFGSTALTSRGGGDVFVFKLDSAGQQLWAVGGGGAEDDWVAGVGLDAAGNGYLAGGFKGTASFGSASLTSRGQDDVFVARVDSAGKFVWAVGAGGDKIDLPLGIAVDGAGNSFITGRFYATASFGSLSLVSSALADVFVAKYDSAGGVTWAVSARGTGVEQGSGIAVDSKGRCHVVGLLEGYRGEFSLGDKTFIPRGGVWDIFAATLDGAGKVTWATSAGGKGFDYGNAVAVDAAGASRIVGRFSGTASFGQKGLTARGKRDVYVWRPR